MIMINTCHTDNEKDEKTNNGRNRTKQSEKH